MTNEISLVSLYINSLNERAYITISAINKLINGKSLSREEYELLSNEKIKSLKEENIDD